VDVPVLVLATSDGERSFEVRAPHAVIGRGEQCAVRLAEPAVSRRHARAEHREGRWLLSDLGSSNGTYVDGHALATGEERALADGDEVRFSADGPALRITMRP
jgi:pSer/pThr/pTyr-binding forkhead associated (FHA) protein